MKKALKIGLISVGSVFLLIAIAVAVALFCIFSPSKLAKIVNSQADKYLTCDFHVDNVGLTFFKTFPKVGLDIENVVLINPQNADVSDTLLYVEDCLASLNIRELLKNRHLEINDFSLNNGLVNLYVDENGKGNYDVIRTDANDTSSVEYTLDLQQVKAKNLDVRYINAQSKQNAKANGVDLTVSGKFENNDIEGQAKMYADNLLFAMEDSTALSFSGADVTVSYEGVFTDFNLLDGNLVADMSNTVFRHDTTTYLNGMDLSVSSDLQADLAALDFKLQETRLKLEDQTLDVNGSVDIDTLSSDIHTDLHYETGNWNIDWILPLIPRPIIGNTLDDMQIHGILALEGDVKGTLSDTETPKVTSGIKWTNGDFAMKGLPLDFTNVEGHFDLNLDLANQTNLTVKSLSATMRNRNKIAASGTVKNLFGKMLCDVSASGKLHIVDFKDFLPEDFTKYDGLADLQVKTQFEYNPEKDFSVDNISKAVINGQFTDLELSYHDTTMIRMPDLKAEIEFPITKRPYHIDEWLNAKLNTSSLFVFNQPEKIAVTADALQLDAYTNNLLDNTIDLKFATTYLFDLLTVNYEDTITAYLNDSKGKFILHNTDQMQLDYDGKKISVINGTVANSFFAETLNLQAKTDYKEKEENPLLRWSPVVNLQLSKARIDAHELTHKIIIPAFDIDFNPQKCVLKKANIQFGESIASLTGTISGIEPYIHDKGLLKGNLDLVADYLNLNELMDLSDGFGAPDSLVEQAEQLEKQGGDSPFIVPFGMDINVKTTIKKALYEEAEFRNIAGRVYVKDGVLVLEEMGLTNDAARMQLTAMYRTPRMNHLFLGFDFHLLDIKIDKLIAMIPEVDTILPMLKAFSGNAEFHFAAETYLKSNYDIKYSTLRGAAAINGHDLVVLDSETFKNISKKLMFSKKTENKIDSLSTEITIFKNEIDVYPFLLSIDKYQAIISGRHNLDMTYDYNISLVKPIRIGLDIIGLEDKLKYKVGKAKYATMFQPEKRKVVESSVLELKTLINKTLQENVR